MVEVCKDVVALDFIQAWHVVLSFATHSIAFQDSDVEVATESERVKVLAS
jgi:hypothetical protein